MSELIDKDEILKKAVTIPGPSGRSVFSVVFTDDVLNAKPIEPTTMNNLGVDCISRKQAIEEADKLCLETGYDNEKVIEMLNELPAVTPQEPTTKNDLGVDCVARQDVERFIEGFINEYTPEEELEFINLELDGLKHLPPATPIRPKGHWIEHPHEAGPNWKYSMYECSECHGWAEDVSDYCPDCGVRMFEPQESEG